MPFPCARGPMMAASIVVATAVSLGGCSTGQATRLSSGGKPTWSLAGGDSGLSQPRGTAFADQQTRPAAQPGVRDYVYRGGRDPSTGRAPSTLPGEQPLPPQKAATAGQLPRAPLQPDRALPTYGEPRPGIHGQNTYAPVEPQPMPARSPAPMQVAGPQPTFGNYGTPAGPGVPYAPPKFETVARGSTLAVMPGDTITGVASRHKVSVAEIMRVNRLQSPVLSPGQQLVIPQR